MRSPPRSRGPTASRSDPTKSASTAATFSLTGARPPAASVRVEASPNTLFFGSGAYSNNPIWTADPKNKVFGEASTRTLAAGGLAPVSERAHQADRKIRWACFSAVRIAPFRSSRPVQ
jgi:hypothetical protein